MADANLLPDLSFLGGAVSPNPPVVRAPTPQQQLHAGMSVPQPLPLGMSATDPGLLGMGMGAGMGMGVGVGVGGGGLSPHSAAGPKPLESESLAAFLNELKNSIMED